MSKVLITGGNKGIGLETTRLFLNAGDKVTVIGRDFSSFELKNEANVTTVEFDISQVDKIEWLVSQLGSFDVLINNAGVMNSLPYDDYPISKKEHLMNVNLYAPIEFITHVSKSMKKTGGRIVNTTSVAGQIGHPDVWYGASKAALINATISFAKLLAKYNITVNAVAPGPTETDMMHVIPEDRRAFMKSLVYLDRFAKPEEIARTIFWLAKDSPEYINGFCVDLNNGAHTR